MGESVASDRASRSSSSTSVGSSGSSCSEGGSASFAARSARTSGSSGVVDCDGPDTEVACCAVAEAVAESEAEGVESEGVESEGVEGRSLLSVKFKPGVCAEEAVDGGTLPPTPVRRCREGGKRGALEAAEVAARLGDRSLGPVLSSEPQRAREKRTSCSERPICSPSRATARCRADMSE